MFQLVLLSRLPDPSGYTFICFWIGQKTFRSGLYAGISVTDTVRGGVGEYSVFFVFV